MTRTEGFIFQHKLKLRVWQVSKQADKSILTKNIRLKTKSRYLMHLIPHETILPVVFGGENDSNQTSILAQKQSLSQQADLTSIRKTAKARSVLSLLTDRIDWTKKQTDGRAAASNPSGAADYVDNWAAEGTSGTHWTPTKHRQQYSLYWRRGGQCRTPMLSEMPENGQQQCRANMGRGFGHLCHDFERRQSSMSIQQDSTACY